jgi:hypothetical protein
LKKRANEANNYTYDYDGRVIQINNKGLVGTSLK